MRNGEKQLIAKEVIMTDDNQNLRFIRQQALMRARWSMISIMGEQNIEICKEGILLATNSIYLMDLVDRTLKDERIN